MCMHTNTNMFAMLLNLTTSASLTGIRTFAKLERKFISREGVR